MNNNQTNNNIQKKQPQLIKGIVASTGIFIGKVFLIEEEELTIIPKKIPKDQLKKEINRYDKSLNEVKQEMLLTKDKLLKTLGKEHENLVDAYLLMLDDPLLNRDIPRRILDEQVNAEYALWMTIEKVVKSFETVEDEYFKERKNDIQEIGKRILRNLIGKYKRFISEAPENSVVIAHNLNPSETILLRERKIGGFAVNIGGRTSHIAILAQNLEIPAVVGLKNITSFVEDNDIIIIDGNEGFVIVNPDAETLSNYQRVLEIQEKEKTELKNLKNLPAQTKDGHKVIIACNFDAKEEIKNISEVGAEGIGLLRTEFIYMNRTQLPSEEEHYKIYSSIAKKILPYSVTIRTFDLGGDKLSAFNIDNFIPETNPILGLRGIRLALKYQEIFRTQLKGILRASNEGKIKIMFPMITCVDEFIQAKNILEEIKQDFKKNRIPFDEKIEVGAMIEVPSAALTSDLIAKEADFLSIGTNDLIQYTLAIDRTNETVAYIYEPMDLSILRLLKHIIDAAHTAGKWVSLCGEMAGDPVFTVILLGMGLNEFSMSVGFVPKIKKIIRNSSYKEAKELADEIFKSFNKEIIIQKINKLKVNL